MVMPRATFGAGKAPDARRLRTPSKDDTHAVVIYRKERVAFS